MYRVIVVDPVIERWIFPEEPDPRDYARIRSRSERRSLLELTRNAAEAINIDELQGRDASSAEFVEAITS